MLASGCGCTAPAPENAHAAGTQQKQQQQRISSRLSMSGECLAAMQREGTQAVARLLPCRSTGGLPSTRWLPLPPLTARVFDCLQLQAALWPGDSQGLGAWRRCCCCRPQWVRLRQRLSGWRRCVAPVAAAAALALCLTALHAASPVG